MEGGFPVTGLRNLVLVSHRFSGVVPLGSFYRGLHLHPQASVKNLFKNKFNSIKKSNFLAFCH